MPCSEPTSHHHFSEHPPDPSVPSGQTPAVAALNPLPQSAPRVCVPGALLPTVCTGRKASWYLSKKAREKLRAGCPPGSRPCSRVVTSDASVTCLILFYLSFPNGHWPKALSTIWEEKGPSRAGYSRHSLALSEPRRAPSSAHATPQAGLKPQRPPGRAPATRL